MPLLSIITNQNISDEPALLKAASSLVAEQCQKPERYVMVSVQQKALCFSGNDEPAAYLELKSLGLTAEQTSPLAQALCQFMAQQLDIPAARVYIEFASPERAFWGWNNHTF
jgi:phenylpyruvate tautomerase PptA (4-oxalocrotonate tautomerase family)